MSDHKLISAVFSSAVKTSVAGNKKKKQVVATKLSGVPDPTAPKPAPPKPEPAEDEDWITVANTRKKASDTLTPQKKAKKQPKKAVLDQKTKTSLANNSFFVPTALQKHLHMPASKPAAKKLPPSKPASKSFLSIMTPTKPSMQKKKHSKKKKKTAKKEQPSEKPAMASMTVATQEKIFVTPEEAEPKVEALVPAEMIEDAKVVDTKTTSIEPQQCLLLGLPYHLLTENIMSFCRPEDIACFAQCNTVSKRIGEEGYLWQSMFRQRFPHKDLSPHAMKEWKLAYQLTLSNIVDHLRCFHTKKTFFEDVLGVGVNYTVNPKTKVVDYIDLTQDLLSETAFRENKIRSDVFGNKFKLFLPLYFSEDHFQRALPQIQKTLRRLCPHRKSYGFEPSMVLDIFPKIMTTFVVLLSDEGVSASRKSFYGLSRVHRLFMALAHEYPSIKREATMRLKHFAAQEKFRTKSACPSLGSILPLFMVVDENEFQWRSIMSVYLEETFDRGVLWVCKKCPRLENIRGPNGQIESSTEAAERVNVTREAMTVTLRLLMFQVYFIRTFCQGTTQQRANHYDRFFGQLDPEVEQRVVSEEANGPESDIDDGASHQLEGESSFEAANASISTKSLDFSSFREQINRILTVSTWQQFFHLIGARCPPTKEEMARRLRKSVSNSRRKGYHKKGMDFARVQQSGTSKILSKGQEYSASSTLKRVTFRDVWGFRGETKFLDATCLLYKGSFRAHTVDFSNISAQNGAVLHSGDVMREDGGTHTIELDLENLDSDITACVFVLSAWAGAKLSDIVSPSVSFSDADTGASLCTYDLGAHDKIPHLTSVIMCKLYRSRKGGWHVQAIGDAHRGAADDYGPIYKAVQELLR